MKDTCISRSSQTKTYKESPLKKKIQYWIDLGEAFPGCSAEGTSPNVLSSSVSQLIAGNQHHAFTVFLPMKDHKQFATEEY